MTFLFGHINDFYILFTVVMALVNVLLDYILIFGKFGMPEMGIKGAAVASVMAEAASLADRKSTRLNSSHP